MEQNMITSFQTNQITNYVTVPIIIQNEQQQGECYGITYDGEGEMEFIDGGFYKGSVSNGFFNGPGEYEWSDGTKIQMKFNYNKFDGQAKIKWRCGSEYEGEVLNGIRNGQGVFKCKEYVYKGQYLNGQKCGKGLMNFKNGQIYDGYFQNDQKQGQGTMTYPSGNCYKGAWVQNQKDGFGVMYWNNQEYHGEWKNNKPNGFGTLIFLDDKAEGRQFRNRYQGEWKDGQRHGYGNFYYSNGSKYEGLWNQNHKDGIALFTNELGQVEKCEFKNDRQLTKNNIQNINQDEIYSSIMNLQDLNIDQDSILKINNLFMRNHQFIKQIQRQQMIHEPKELLNPNIFCMRLYNFHNLLKDSKTLDGNVSLVQINRFFNFGQESHFSVNSDLDNIKFKIDFIKNIKHTNLKKINDSYIIHIIQTFQKDKSIYQNEKIQENLKRALLIDFHDKEQIILNRQKINYLRQFVDLLIRFFYLKNNLQFVNIEITGDSIFKNKLFPIMHKRAKHEDVGNQSQQSNLKSQRSKQINFTFDDYNFVTKLKLGLQHLEKDLQQIFNTKIVYKKQFLKSDKTILIKSLIEQLQKAHFIEDLGQEIVVIYQIQQKNEEKYDENLQILLKKNQQNLSQKQLDKIQQQEDQIICSFFQIELAFYEYYDLLLQYFLKPCAQLKFDQLLKNIEQNIEIFCQQNQFQANKIKDQILRQQTFKDLALVDLQKKKEEIQLKLEQERLQQIILQKQQREQDIMGREDQDVPSVNYSEQQSQEIDDF